MLKVRLFPCPCARAFRPSPRGDCRRRAAPPSTLDASATSFSITTNRIYKSNPFFISVEGVVSTSFRSSAATTTTTSTSANDWTSGRYTMCQLLKVLSSLAHLHPVSPPLPSPHLHPSLRQIVISLVDWEYFQVNHLVLI